jgi:hypothetical protein
MHNLKPENSHYFWKQGPSVPGKGDVQVLRAGKLRVELLTHDERFFLTCKGLGLEALEILVDKLADAQFIALNTIYEELHRALNDLTMLGGLTAQADAKVETEAADKANAEEDTQVREKDSEKAQEEIEKDEFAFEL